MVGWRTAGAGRTEDGKERDPNQSSSKMDGARKGMEKRRRGRDGFNRDGSVEKDAGRGAECVEERWFKQELGGQKWVEVQQAFGLPSPSCLQHQWCSHRAWHCVMPRCGLPNEPSEARLYLGPGESRRPPLPAGYSLVE